MVTAGRPPAGRPAPHLREPGGPSEEARRQVTVLFCDLVGSTSLAAELDPEELRELLGRYHRAAAGAVEDYGGRLHHTLGDGLMASWGFPQAHEDDATRAVHAGLAVLDAVRAAREEAPTARIEVRAAVHTGLALVADTTLGSRREVANLIGETPNIAARLQDVAHPGSLVMSAATAELVHGRFESVPIGDVILRGVPYPVGAHQVLSAAEGDRLSAHSDPPPITGRDAELEVIRVCWQAVTAGASRALLVRGEAGIGKTLLVRHACAAASRSGGRQLILQCAALQGKIAFYPVRRMLERAAGLGATDPDRTRRLALAAFCAAHPALAADPEAPGLLASLLGVADDSGPGLNPGQRRERVFATLHAYVSGLAADGPLVVAVEDLHWADHSTLEFVRRLAERPPPGTLVMLTARTIPEPPARGATVLGLAPLAPVETARLVQRACPGLAAGIGDLVARRADGIPLFAEELARVLARAERDGLDGGLDGAGVPPRLHDLLVARLDERPAARPLLQALATVGASAPRSLLERTCGLPAAKVRRLLEVLVEAGVLTKHEPGRDPVFRFRHVLLRDAAYATLPRSRRRALHATVADDLLSGDGNVVPAIVAYHLEQSGDAAASVTWWLRAGYAAAEVAAHREVVDTLRHLLDILPASGPVAEVDELKVLALLCVSLVALEGYTSEEVARLQGRARELVERSAKAPDASTIYPLWAYHHVRGELSVSAALAERLHGQAAEGSAAERAMAAAMVAFDLMEQGRLRAALPYLEEARLSAQHAPPGIPHEIGPAVGVLEGITRWLLGQHERGRNEVAAAVRAAESLGLPRGPFTRAFVHTYAAWWTLLADDPHSAPAQPEAAHAAAAHAAAGHAAAAHAAAAHATAAIAEATEHGFPSWLAAATMHAAGAQARLGGPQDAAAAAATIEQLLGAWRAAGAETFRPEFLRWLAEARSACGDTKGALAAVREGLEHVRRFGGRMHEPELHRFEGILLAAGDERAAAVAALQSAARVAGDLGARSFEARALADLDRLG